jgi:hypothetical protein
MDDHHFGYLTKVTRKKKQLQARPVSFTWAPLTFSTLPSSHLKSKKVLYQMAHFLILFFWSGEGTSVGANSPWPFLGIDFPNPYQNIIIVSEQIFFLFVLFWASLYVHH